MICSSRIDFSPFHIHIHIFAWIEMQRRQKVSAQQQLPEKKWLMLRQAYTYCQRDNIITLNKCLNQTCLIGFFMKIASLIFSTDIKYTSHRSVCVCVNK